MRNSPIATQITVGRVASCAHSPLPAWEKIGCISGVANAASASASIPAKMVAIRNRSHKSRGGAGVKTIAAAFVLIRRSYQAKIARV
jgi:hypothetical protein